jgi:hypothetical protein
MRSNRIFGSLCAALISVACAGVITGCGSGSEEIPLAKVPPPPENFSRVQAKSDIPKTASPTNANERRR